MPTKKTETETEIDAKVTDQADEILAEARKEAAGQRLLDALRADSGQRQAEVRAADPADPMTADQAVDLAVKATEAAALADTVIAAAGLTKADLISQVSAARRQELTQNLDQWRKTLAIHQSFLDDPASWGGVDIGGQPIDADEQAAHIKTYEAAIADAEAELAVK